MTILRAVTFAIALIAVPAFADDDHPPLPSSVERFHDIISKDWHAEQGSNRLRATCSHSGAYILASGEVVADKVPQGVDAEKWKKAAAALSAGSTGLGTYCASGDDNKILIGLTKLHDRFHDLVKLIKHK